MSLSQLKEPEHYLAHCDVKGCYLHVGVWTMEAAVQLLDHHQCPYYGGETRISWEIVITTLVERMWEMADEGYEKLITATEPDDKLKGELRGYAEMIALFMSPYFKSANEIVHEVVKRWKMKEAGERYETPGIGARMYETPPNEPNKYARVSQATKPPPEPIVHVSKQTKHNLSDSDCATIRETMQAGMMTAEMMAPAFGVTPAIIRAIAEGRA